MPRIFLITLFTTIILSSLIWAWQGKVVHVTDGDTIVVLTEDKEQIRIRLYGIDAPESKQPFGRVATRFVRDIAALEIVEIDERYLDRYGRTIATVFLPDGTNLNEELVRVGLAWVYTRYCDEQPMCSRWDALQQEARENRIGLWVDKNPVPPWEWRRKR